MEHNACSAIDARITREVTTTFVSVFAYKVYSAKLGKFFHCNT